MKTIGGWIQAKRIEKNLSRYHLATKMGIATALVRAWEEGAREPNDQQLRVLMTVWGIQMPLATPEMKGLLKYA